MSYVGSAQRIMRLRRRAPGGWQKNALTVLAVVLVLAAWAVVTCWYCTLMLLLVPYRLLRRGARKRKAEAIRHRELMDAIQRTAAASSATVASAAPTISAGIELPALTE
jgi:hypothetical protein